MTKKVIVRSFVAAGALAVFGSPQIASASTPVVPCAGPTTSNVWSCSTGVYVNLSFLSLVGVGVGPLANSYGTAPSAYDITNTLASLGAAAGTTVLIPGALGATASLGVQTGLITDTAKSTYTGGANPSATATSTVDGLAVSLNLLGASLLSVGSLGTGPTHTNATTLTSTSTATRNDGGTVQLLTGTSSIENLNISVAGVPVPITVDLSAGTPPNTELLPAVGDITGLQIFANYQNPILLNGNKVGIQTAALAILFNNFAVGLNALNGEVLIADSAAAVPEPVTWMMMLFGFGLVGAMARRRQTPALSPA